MHDRSGTGQRSAWCAHALRTCAPATLRMIASLLLEPSDVAALAAASGSAAVTRPCRAIDIVVTRCLEDAALAARLARRLSRRAATVEHLLACSPYEILALWGARRRALSRRELGAMLARLACNGDPALAPLAQRLRHEVELEALRALPDVPVG